MSEPTGNPAPDYRAIEIQVCFRGYGDGRPADMALADGLIDDEYHPVDLSELELAEDECARLGGIVEADIATHLSSLSGHYALLGGFRADGVYSPHLESGETAWGTDADRLPTYFLVFRDSFAPEDGYRIGDILTSATDQTIPNSALSGSTITFRATGSIVDPRELFETLSARSIVDGVGVWGGEGTPDALPESEESYDCWVERVAISGSALNSSLEKWELAGRDIGLFSRYMAPRVQERPLWLVDGVVPFGEISHLVGSGESGKSSAAHELLSAVGGIARARPKTWLGQKIDGRFPTALFCGEESDWIIDYRRERHATIWDDCGCMRFFGSADDLVPHLNSLAGLQPGLLVIDSLQTFIEGDDTKAHVASIFYDPIRKFARQSGWAVLIVHHLIKNPATRFDRMISSVKGATTHTDRSRIVNAMISRGNGLVEVAPIKFNFPEELVWAKRYEGRLFRRDPETFTLIPVDAAGAPPTPAFDNVDAAVLKAIADLNARGATVRRTGRWGVFEQKIEALSGLSRSVIQGAISRLMGAARLLDSSEGLRVVLPPESPS